MARWASGLTGARAAAGRRCTRNDIPVDAGSPEQEGLARRLDKPMGVLGLVFVLVVLGQPLDGESWLVTVPTVVG